jgi:hypothetical protein
MEEETGGKKVGNEELITFSGECEFEGFSVVKGR